MNLNIKKLLIIASLLLLPTTMMLTVASAAPTITDQKECEAAKGAWKIIPNTANSGYCDTTETPLPASVTATAVYTKEQCIAAKGDWVPGGTTPTGTEFAASCSNPTSLPPPPGGIPVENFKTPEGVCNQSNKGDSKCCDSANLSADNCDIVKFANTAFSAVAGFIGLAVTGNIIWAGIQYSMSQGDPSKAAKAKDRIRGAIIALIMFLSLSAFIEWLIPGGIFG
jgi:hypothetical protein